MNSLSDLQKLLDDNGQRVTEVNVLFLDVSSTCTGFTVAKVNFETKTANFVEAGSVWIPDGGETKEAEHMNKCGYMYNMLANYFSIGRQVDYIVMEKYSVNSQRMMGVLLTPMIHGALLAAMSECGLKYSYVFPQTWRSQLGIKYVKDSKGKRDYKTPTKAKVLTYVEVPDQVVNNLTGNTRTTSSDLYDALAIGIAWLQKLGIRHMRFDKIKFQPHAGTMSQKGELP
jgi:hypothetical protein